MICLHPWMHQQYRSCHFSPWEHVKRKQGLWLCEDQVPYISRPKTMITDYARFFFKKNEKLLIDSKKLNNYFIMKITVLFGIGDEVGQDWLIPHRNPVTIVIAPLGLSVSWNRNINNIYKQIMNTLYWDVFIIYAMSHKANYWGIGSNV